MSPQQKDLIDIYTRHSPVHPDGKKMTFEEFLIAMGNESSLPPRFSENITPLVTLLDNVIFMDKKLKPAVESNAPAVIAGGERHERFSGNQVMLHREFLEDRLGAGYHQRYHMRDWTDAVTETLVRRGCPRNLIEFGTKYRVGLNWKGDNEVFLQVDPSLLRICSVGVGALASHPSR